jgi:hypothetical protein
MSLRRSLLSLESLEQRDAPAFLVSLSTAPSYSTPTRSTAPTTAIVSSSSLVNTTVPLNWSAPSYTIPLNWSSVYLR